MPLKYPLSRFLVNFKIFFGFKMTKLELSIYYVFIINYDRTLLKVSKSEI